MRAQPASANGLGELRLQDAHAPQLPAQAALDLAQSGLKLQLLPVLAHGALLLAEPLILDAGPVRERCEEALVLVRHARAQLLEVRASGMAAAREALAGARELHGEEGALELEDRRALGTAPEAHHLQPRDEPLGRIPLPPAHDYRNGVRGGVVEAVKALAVGDDRGGPAVGRWVGGRCQPAAPQLESRVDV